MSVDEVENGEVSMYLFLKSGSEVTRLGEQRISLSELLLPNAYAAEKERSHIIPLSIAHTQLKIQVLRATNVMAADNNGLSDPYCVITGILRNRGKGEQIKTSVCKETLNPVWRDEPAFFGSQQWIIEDYTHIRIKVFDRDRFNSDDILGVVYIPVEMFQSAEQTLTFDIQRTEDMTNVSADTNLGQLVVNTQRLRVDPRVVANTPDVKLQVAVKASHCNEFSSYWPANSFDQPEEYLHVSLGYDSIIVKEPKQYIPPPIRQCCSRVRMPAMPAFAFGR